MEIGKNLRKNKSWERCDIKTTAILAIKLVIMKLILILTSYFYKQIKKIEKSMK